LLSGLTFAQATERFTKEVGLLTAGERHEFISKATRHVQQTTSSLTSGKWGCLTHHQAEWWVAVPLVLRDKIRN